ncbi:hypothetical protein P7B02_16085 [Caulobacter segnis]|uniref:hypothetical protein n=1 Tax=Caulobacter segnis TaxID=88688 RepID=UPI002410AD92|nr:hypothetical protein [Caulobacter segnis]MDG2523056.1 hypothetical protein [Caulobacter segnis]
MQLRTALAAFTLLVTPAAAMAQTTSASATVAPAAKIDRKALVSRHNPTLTAVDRHAPVMLGNGDIGFTADITGLQTFPEQYSELAPLLTMAQWAWHSFPNPKGYTEQNGLVNVPVAGRGEQPYAWMKSWNDAETNPAFTWLRANPHRFSLGRVGLIFADGLALDFAKVSKPHQTLDLWTGTLSSRFTYDGQPVTVTTRVHPELDMVMVEVASPLVAKRGLGVQVRYPTVNPAINPDPTSFDKQGAQSLTVLSAKDGETRIRRTIDETTYFSTITANGHVKPAGDSFQVAAAKGQSLQLTVRFDEADNAAASPAYADGVKAATTRWNDFWSKGGAVDFSGSTDPRAKELERRVVLSQYLSAVNGAGELPPQEEGLFSNSWYGKFHLEMHPWHSGWQAMWGHADLLERSLPWYVSNLPNARAEAARHGVKGAWWPKMAGPEGRNSPSLVSPFIMWQQPHPILMAELVWRAEKNPEVLNRYGEVVESTADLLASWPLEHNGRLNLGPPLIPAQENYDPLTTVNPTFEVEYFRWALQTAQAWRERQGQARRADWDAALAKIAPPATRDGLYLPVENVPDFWTTAMSEACRNHASAAQCKNRDHPSFLMAYGFIPGERIDKDAMKRTFAAVEANWDVRQTWGWDFPMMAMTAARLGQPEKAVDWLFADLKNNQWGVTGMTPRVHLDEHADDLVPASAGAGGVKMTVNPDGAGYRRAAETYFPSNGSLLMAVGLMAGGWDGSTGHAPGFPKSGWTVRVEGLTPAP